MDETFIISLYMNQLWDYSRKFTGATKQLMQMKSQTINGGHGLELGKKPAT